MTTERKHKIDWTPDQLRGIETVGRSLLISAAAGSGKTAVLAERCAYLVCQAPEPHRCDVDELLVVTFTQAAATEMRGRIERALRDRMQAGHDSRLARQIMLLDRAQICTLHSFCASVLRRHFNLAGLDPNFRTLDEDESLLTRLETARELLAARYESDGTGAFQRLIDHHADANDERIIGRIISTHNMLCSMCERVKWLSDAVQRIAQATSRPLTQSWMGQELRALIERRLTDLRRRCSDTATLLSRSPELAKYLDYVGEMIAGLACAQRAFLKDGFDGLAAVAEGLKPGKLPSIPSGTTGRDRAKALIDALREELQPKGALYELCRFSAEDWVSGLKQIVEPAGVLVELVREFSQRYEAAKRGLGALDFNDLERMTFNILRSGSADDGRPLPSGTARTYHRQFRHVLVDEYQDINEIQDAILSLVSRECVGGEEGATQNLFCVGDVKQSIYRFRLADPRRFLKRNERLRAMTSRDIGEVIDLQSNFRSRAPLLDAINAVFERLMTEPAAELNYDQSHRLQPGAEYPPASKHHCFDGAPIELHLLPPPQSGSNNGEPAEGAAAELELDRTEREAAFVARRIRDLMSCESSKRLHVVDKLPDGSKVLRPIRLQDIVILLRAMLHKAEVFTTMLRMNGIAVHHDSGTGFFESMEVGDMLSLLTVLDNVQQDIPLAAVLRSPLSGLAEADNSLARIRLAYRGSHDRPLPFHRAVVRYAAEQHDELAAHLRDVLTQLRQWREMAQYRPLAELLWTIYDTTGYLAFSAGLSDGEQRAANLIELHERARQFGSFQRQGLRRFLQFLETLRQEKDLALPSIASQADDVVRVMSIHRAKGLEFPVVILPDLGKRHNLEETQSSILIDREAGLGLLCVDERLRILYPSMASVLVQDRIRRQSLAEEMRVLYVAMTRAREHLILVGTCRSDQTTRWSERWAKHQGPLPPEEVLRGNCMLDWVGPVAAATAADCPAPFAVTMHEEEEVRSWAAPRNAAPMLDDWQQQRARLEPLSRAPAPHPEAEQVRRRLTQAYAYQPFTAAPASISVGLLTKPDRPSSTTIRPAPQHEAEIVRQLPPPRCVMESRSPTSMEVGSAVHLVLQHLDFARACDRSDILAQIDGMVARKLLPAGDAAAVDISTIEWLISTPLGKLLKTNAHRLRRELPIIYPKNIPVDGELQSTDPLDRMMVRGRIDVMIPDGPGWVLADYKTDRVTAETIADRAAFYRPQLRSYSGAVEAIVSQPVLGAYLVFLTARTVVQVQRSET